MLQVSSTLQAAASQKAQSADRQHSPSSERQAPPSAMSSTASEAFLQCIERVCSPAVAGAVGRATAVGLLQDVATVVKHGRSVVVLGLIDMQRLFTTAQDCLAHMGRLMAVAPGIATQAAAPVQVTHKMSSQTNLTPSKQRSAAKLKIRGALRKLHFFLSWANELSGTVYADLLQAVIEELKHHSSTLSVPEKTPDLPIFDPFVKSTMQPQSSPHHRPVVEEI